jgi:kynurenine formamidase
VITKEVAGYMLDSGKRGIGLDVISLDPASDVNLTLHKYVLGAGRDFVIVENLCGLNRIGSGLFTFAALPVRYADADGAPVRAAAIIPDVNY